MTSKTLIFRCGYCSCETAITINVSQTQLSGNSTNINIVRYCQYCEHKNIISIPETWDSNPLVLGDNNFLGYKEGIPIIQGSRE